MRRIIADQNILIDLQNGELAARELMADPQVLLYLQDANIAEAGCESTDCLIALLHGLLPYRNQLRLAPAHGQLFTAEKDRRRAVAAGEVHEFNDADALTAMFDDVVSGGHTIRENLSDPENRRQLQAQLDNHPRVMIAFHDEVSAALVTCDTAMGMHGRSSMAVRMRRPEIIDDSVLELCLGLAMQQVEMTTREETQVEQIVTALSHEPSFHLVYYLTKYIRVIQKMANDSLGNMVRQQSNRLGNEYFDTLNVSLVPFFDDFFTNDRVTKATVRYVRRALQLFPERRATLIDRLAAAADRVRRQGNI